MPRWRCVVFKVFEVMTVVFVARVVVIFVLNFLRIMTVVIAARVVVVFVFNVLLLRPITDFAVRLRGQRRLLLLFFVARRAGCGKKN